jgi:hypothetical protein
MAFRSKATAHTARFSSADMRDQSAISASERPHPTQICRSSSVHILMQGDST